MAENWGVIFSSGNWIILTQEILCMTSSIVGKMNCRKLEKKKKNLKLSCRKLGKKKSK